MSTRPEDYTVGWICAITTEHVVACEMLDVEYARSQAPRINTYQDSNFYTFGRIHEHNIVIACLPKGRYGTSSATSVAKDMLRSFPKIRFGLMVGIGGAASILKYDIRLGDVVVSSPEARHGGVVHYEFGKAIQEEEFEETGNLAPPPKLLLHAMNEIISLHERRGHRINHLVELMLRRNGRLRAKYGKPDAKHDRLYRADYVHQRQADGCHCTLDTKPDKPLSPYLVPRKHRTEEDAGPKVHYGLIASADKLIKNASIRDALSSKHNVLCFEMEAAGLMDSFPCIVIRGICDYSDTHKNDLWQGYAAATAAAYAKEMLNIIPGSEIDILPVKDILKEQKDATESFISTTETVVETPLTSEHMINVEATHPGDAVDLNSLTFGISESSLIRGVDRIRNSELYIQEGVVFESPLLLLVSQLSAKYVSSHVESARKQWSRPSIMKLQTVGRLTAQHTSDDIKYFLKLYSIHDHELIVSLDITQFDVSHAANDLFGQNQWPSSLSSAKNLFIMIRKQDHLDHYIFETSQESQSREWERLIRQYRVDFITRAIPLSFTTDNDGNVDRPSFHALEESLASSPRGAVVVGSFFSFFSPRSLRQVTYHDTSPATTLFREGRTLLYSRLSGIGYGSWTDVYLLMNAPNFCLMLQFGARRSFDLSDCRVTGNTEAILRAGNIDRRYVLKDEFKFTFAIRHSVGDLLILRAKTLQERDEWIHEIHRGGAKWKHRDTDGGRLSSETSSIISQSSIVSRRTSESTFGSY